MVLSCVAFNCRSRFMKGSGISYHRFPSDPHVRNIWRLALRRKNFKPSNHSVICSRHFTRESYVTERFGPSTLKKDAVPTIFDFPRHVRLANKTGNSRRQTSRKAPIRMCNNNGEDILNKRSITDVNGTGESSPSEVTQHNSENGLLSSSSVLLTSENKDSSATYVQSIAKSGRLPHVYTQSVPKSSEVSSTRVVENLHSSSAHSQLVAENAKITSTHVQQLEKRQPSSSFGIQLVPEGRRSSFVRGQPMSNNGQILLTAQLNPKMLSTDALFVTGSSQPPSHDQSVAKNRLSSFPINDSLDAEIMSLSRNEIHRTAEDAYPSLVVATLVCKNELPDYPDILSDAKIDHAHSYASPASQKSNDSKQKRKTYVGDFKATDMISFTEAKRFYEIATAKVLAQQGEIRQLKRQNNKLMKQVQRLKLIVEMTDVEKDER